MILPCNDQDISGSRELESTVGNVRMDLEAAGAFTEESGDIHGR